EMENGVITSVRKIKEKKPVEEYLKRQRRFAHLFRDEKGRKVIEDIQRIADENIKIYGLMD
ncbi:MAG: pyruvate ferredoxin oxidoreductase, partial [Archaeoglobi archaeon]|nr:pyruvate ferredoxin oxidoreductase [Candidatus Mnemosynella sp.]